MKHQHSDTPDLGQPYHYTLCGLDNIFLYNGYTLEPSDYGETFSVENLDGLHQAIARSIIEHDRRLSGKEFRFLRLELAATQKIVADWMDVDVQTVARWEKGKTSVDPVADRLIRLIYLENIKQRFHITELLERLSEMDEPLTDIHNFMFDQKNGWHHTHQMAA